MYMFTSMHTHKVQTAEHSNSACDASKRRCGQVTWPTHIHNITTSGPNAARPCDMASSHYRAWQCQILVPAITNLPETLMHSASSHFTQSRTQRTWKLFSRNTWPSFDPWLKLFGNTKWQPSHKAQGCQSQCSPISPPSSVGKKHATR